MSSYSLDKPTRDGESELALLTNLPKEAANARQVGLIYRKRWTIETAFQLLTEALCCEINTLCYPKAALFGFCVALVTYNVLGVVRGVFGRSTGPRRWKNYRRIK